MRIICAYQSTGRHQGQVMDGSPHREGERRKFARGSRQILDPRVVPRACEQLGLDPAQLPGKRRARLRARCYHD
jgi:hypothetical protein